jgi:hypothetical protein
MTAVCAHENLMSRYTLASVVDCVVIPRRERNGGWGLEVSYALPGALIAGAVLIGLLELEKGEILPPLLTFNVRRPVITLGVGAGRLFVLTRPPRESARRM